MRIALIGAYGQLGTDLRSALGDEAVPLGHADVAIERAESVAAALDRARPDRVVNAAAYNLVDKAEDEPDVAFAVNALGPRNIARWCAAHDVPFLHISTDYVFSGRRAEQGAASGHSEGDLPDPQGAYAVSKLAGEHFVAAAGPRHFLVRTCGLYGRREGGGKANFVDSMLRLGRDRAPTGQPLRVVDDHWCTPTSTADLARALADLLRTDAWGLYHATNSGATTWRQFAEEIFRIAGLAVEVRPITSAQFGAKAPRPSNSVLDCRRLAGVLGAPLPSWQESLRGYLDGADL